MEDFDYWRLNDDLSIIEAALLVIGEDPGQLAPYVEGYEAQNQPRGYMAARNGIAGGLRKGLITGDLIPLDEVDWNGNPVGEIVGSTNFVYSRVHVESLKQWLSNRGIPSLFFFPATADTPGYLDPGHPRYAPKLAAAVLVWQAMGDENLIGPKGLMSSMEEWLGSRYKELSLEWQGVINKSGISEAAKVANWKTSGGATKTPGG